MLPRIASYARQHHLALIALFIAMGGTSYAAAKLPKNSVGPRQIKSNAVTAPKVQNGSLLMEDFKAGSIPQGKAGEPGAPGAPGPKGDQGLKGDPGPTQAVANQTTQPDPSYSAQTSKQITTSTAGKLWVQGVDSYTASSCTGGTGKYSIALTVDGAYIAGTRRDLSLPDSGANGTASTFGVTSTLPAGTYAIATVAQMLSCNGGYGIDTLVGAIAVGD